MVQVPPAISDAVLADTVQTDGVSELKLTAKPELAVAERFTLVRATCEPGFVKVMVCDFRAIASALQLDRLRGVARR